MILNKALLLTLTLASPNTENPIAHTHVTVANETPAALSAIFQGLQPEFYLRMRRPEPNIDRELDKGLPYVTQFMGIYNNLEAYPFASNAEYPPHLSAKTIAHLQIQERIALQSGIIRLVAQSQHPAAFDFLRDIISNDDEKMALRSTATRALANIQHENTQAYLQALLANPAEELRVRSAALQALAYFKTPEVLEQFKTLIWSNNTPELTRALVPALATLGTQQPLARGADLQEKVSALLAEFLLSSHDNTRHIQPNLLVQAFGRVPHPNTIKILKEALKSNQTQAQKQRIRSALRHMELAQKRTQTR
ncbi:MAG: HEAT repeat domain-containing protein [Myxococcota bacterium]|nr:HEAT repeat domain-containing protein [Myxococcota bacterium]